MKIRLTIVIAAICFSASSFAQTLTDSSAKELDEVVVSAFEQNRKLKQATATVKIIEINNGDRYNKTSLVNGFNTVAGVRMEERSPGSYRINIRGSSLRSPFGVRNVKVYWNDIPVTDPGGNTYFNQFAWNNFNYIELLKGPAGSMYGAGTGGLILMNSLNKRQPGASIEYVTGSYNLQNIFAEARFGSKENFNQFTFARNQTDGYRVQSKMERANFSWQSQVKFSEKQTLTGSVLFTDLFYQTPGALNAAEFTANPKAARPAAGIFPGAENAKAAIYQKNITTGLTNQYYFTKIFKNTTTLYGVFNQIKNPAIRNYERRNEPGFGARTVFTYKKDFTEYTGPKESSFQIVWGGEYLDGFFNTQVSKNKNGNPDTLQTNDDIRNTAYNFFVQGDIIIRENWFINAGVSANKTKVEFTRLNKYPVVKQNRTYQNELAPRISIKRKLKDDLFLSGTFSRGFSPPTIGELLPSTGNISTNLEAEYGWNYELTARYSIGKNKHSVDLEATGFIFQLNKALVQRRDAGGADFFVNAGNTKQRGVEATVNYTFNPFDNRLINYININTAYTYNRFRYGSFIQGINDYSGKILPSVPGNTLSVLADLQLKNGFYSNVTFYYASSIFLNDANTAKANEYNLLGWRLGWKKAFTKKYKLNLYAGADNLLDEMYSLGNDINAAAGRYFNAAPRRNYYAGMAIQFIKQKK
jgi:iron complex outermembrane recepter protein